MRLNRNSRVPKIITIYFVRSVPADELRKSFFISTIKILTSTCARRRQHARAHERAKMSPSDLTLVLIFAICSEKRNGVLSRSTGLAQCAATKSTTFRPPFFTPRRVPSTWHNPVTLLRIVDDVTGSVLPDTSNNAKIDDNGTSRLTVWKLSSKCRPSRLCVSVDLRAPSSPGQSRGQIRDRIRSRTIAGACLAACRRPSTANDRWCSATSANFRGSIWHRTEISFPGCSACGHAIATGRTGISGRERKKKRDTYDPPTSAFLHGDNCHCVLCGNKRDRKSARIVVARVGRSCNRAFAKATMDFIKRAWVINVSARGREPPTPTLRHTQFNARTCWGDHTLPDFMTIYA